MFYDTISQETVDLMSYFLTCTILVYKFQPVSWFIGFRDDK